MESLGDDLNDPSLNFKGYTAKAMKHGDVASGPLPKHVDFFAASTHISDSNARVGYECTTVHIKHQH